MVKVVRLVHDLVVFVLRLEVRNLERPHGVERQDQCRISLARATSSTKSASVRAVSDIAANLSSGAI